MQGCFGERKGSNGATPMIEAHHPSHCVAGARKSLVKKSCRVDTNTFFRRSVVYTRMVRFTWEVYENGIHHWSWIILGFPDVYENASFYQQKPYTPPLGEKNSETGFFSRRQASGGSPLVVR